MDDDESEEIEEEIEVREPQVDSSDPNERKLARRLRIERRLEAIRKQNMAEGEEVEEVVEKTLLQKQLVQSAEILEKLVIEGNELVTNVRVANECREVDRREEEGVNREKIMERLDEEAAAAQEMFTEINNKWSSILKYNDPLNINEEMVSQREKCEELMKQKDEVIAMLRSEIKTAEIKFAKDQRKQNEDITTLASRIERQITLMRRAYRQELQLMEDVITIERKMMIDAIDRKWEELYKRRDHEEISNSDKKFEQLDEFEEESRLLRIQHQEKYRETKIKLENDIENLQKELEQIKALALINSEKLDYNYQILTKREDENIIIKSQQKRRINKLQDAINDLRKKISDYLRDSNNQIAKLTDEVIKLQRNVLDVEEKADHFSQTNDVRYRQIWQLNQTRATEVLDKILTTDRILYEQQLGLKWTPPEQKLLNKEDLPTYQNAIEVVTDIYQAKKSEKSGVSQNISKITALDNKKGYQTEPGLNTMIYKRLLQSILKQISNKSGFLIEDRLKIILKPFIDHEKTLVRVDSVFAALSVKKKEEIDLLVDFFLPYSHCPICTGEYDTSAGTSEIEVAAQSLIVDYLEVATLKGSSTESVVTVSDVANIRAAVHQPEEIIDEILSKVTDIGDDIPILPAMGSALMEGEAAGPSTLVVTPTTDLTRAERVSPHGSLIVSTNKFSCQSHHPLVINSVFILRALKEFISKFYVAKEPAVTMSKRLSHVRSTVSRLIGVKDVELYWSRFTTVFSPSRQQVWDGLQVGFQKYLHILTDRQKLNDEVMSLRRQNLELRHLLTSYKAEKEKLKPPCALDREIPLRGKDTPPGCRSRKL